MIITLCVSVPMSFSFGIVMWEIATREKPFNGMYLPTTALNIATSVFFLGFYHKNNVFYYYLDYNPSDPVYSLQNFCH